MTEERITFMIDALVPADMARKSEQIGVAKVNIGPFRMFALAVLAGAFISMGAVFATMVTTGAAGEISYGVTKLLGGFVFCLGLILVIGAGAELFTGNNLIVMAWAGRKVSTIKLLKNWVIVYFGNFVGSILSAAGIFLTGQFAFNQGAVGLNALNIANGKMQYGFMQAIMLGIFCNGLVCLAVWLAMGGRSVTDKILAIIFPITAFVAAGFEHSVANMYFVPIGLMIRAGAPASFWADIGKTSADYADLTWSNFLLANLLPVSIGNIIGGVLLVGLAYWFIYLRPSWTGRQTLQK